MVGWSDLSPYIPTWMEGREWLVAAGAGGSLLLAFVIAKILRGGDRKTYPPGPKGSYFVGNIGQLDPTAPYKTLTEWVKDYGDVYTISILGKKHVVVSGYPAIYEAMVTKTDDFAGRPDVFRARFFTNFYGGLVFGKADQRWLRMKKLAANAMKMYGDGLGKLEDITLEIVGDLLTELQKEVGKPISLAIPLRSAMANIISSILYAKKLDEDRLQALMEVEMPSAEMLTPTGPGSELDMMPWLRHLPTPFYRKMNDIQRKMWAWFEQERIDRQASRSADDIECVMDSFLDAQAKDQVENAGNMGLRDGDITAASMDLIFAGTTTSSSLLLALISLMVTQPEFQKKLRTEAKKVLGTRRPKLSDRSNMPYTEAAILEGLRYVTAAPIPAPRETTTDTSLEGHPIPVGTTVMFNMWNLHHDDRYWDNPWEFRPERFLDANGQLIPPHHPNRQRLLPFSAGRRVCIGESMARNRIFIFMAMLIQRFEFVIDELSGLPDSDPRNYVCGIVLCPKDFNIKLKPVGN